MSSKLQLWSQEEVPNLAGVRTLWVLIFMMHKDYIFNLSHTIPGKNL